ncbi:nuclear transcription factor Y subunit A-7-like [Impatiens glandulifera]|uniref:nuclear transcription factor Y subunit A-7-like n=1 Tax=Impatiens glandulifera TaxID=253017 RepID=UPI001FB06C6E|nr:nuclear transcription factor Y subunit A-7-like [Impatiens glandulifera]XP_047326541.1 nuclear transcription factor Y subunit A-7-like [Impatiens glandulifera]
MVDKTDNEVSKQQKYSEDQLCPSPKTGTCQPGIATSNIPFVIPPQQIGAGNVLGHGAYSYPDPYYRSIFSSCSPQPYSLQSCPVPSMVHLQLMGIQQAGVPLPSDAVEEPVFVNAKQYHGIMRRRQSRLKAEAENKALKAKKPYLHESRHQHALRRPRGCGGRFVNTKKTDNMQKDGTPPPPDNATIPKSNKNGLVISESTTNSS